MTDRLTQLLAFYEEDPSDPFNGYALALEYRKSSASKAAAQFEKLLKDFPDYVPTYYQAAQFYAELGQSEQTRRTYETGIETARRQGNAHALRELRSAYQQWLDEEE
jgi:tetratricopeptide (TPR) repeat protein